MIEGFWERVLFFTVGIAGFLAVYIMFSQGLIETGGHRFTREDHPVTFWTLAVGIGITSVIFILYSLRKEE